MRAPQTSSLSDMELLRESLPSTMNIGTEGEETVHEAARSNNNLDDIFGSAPASPSTEATQTTTGNHEAHPSDIPRLRSTHVTNGYRDGISASKAQYVQEGFDEGYSLGAVLGLKVGWILGILTGIDRALSSAADASQVTGKERVTKARQQAETARSQLSLQKVFGQEYFDEEGIWKYDVPGQDDEEVTFELVAEAHPLVKRWKAEVESIAKMWSVDLGVLEKRYGQAPEKGD